MAVIPHETTTTFLVKTACHRLRGFTGVHERARCSFMKAAVGVEQVLGVNLFECGKSFSNCEMECTTLDATRIIRSDAHFAQ